MSDELRCPYCERLCGNKASYSIHKAKCPVKKTSEAVAARIIKTVEESPEEPEWYDIPF